MFLSVPVDSKESQSLVVSTIACATRSFPDGHCHFMYVLTNAFGHFLMRHSKVVFTQCFVVLLSLQLLRVRGILKYMATDTLMCESAPDPHRRGRGGDGNGVVAPRLCFAPAVVQATSLYR